MLKIWDRAKNGVKADLCDKKKKKKVPIFVYKMERMLIYSLPPQKINSICIAQQVSNRSHEIMICM